jgi:hypothetical protein
MTLLRAYEYLSQITTELIGFSTILRFLIHDHHRVCNKNNTTFHQWRVEQELQGLYQNT